jgi:AhpD family alkylhydroperoxidase
MPAATAFTPEATMTEVLRSPYWEVAADATRTLGGLNVYLRQRSSLQPSLVDLIFLRVSQINGCAYCVESHARELRQSGQSDERIDSLAAWYESPAFTPAEKAALAWTESLTRIEGRRAPATDYEPLQAYWGEREIADISFAVALMNAWNRVAIGFRHAPSARVA